MRLQIETTIADSTEYNNKDLEEIDEWEQIDGINGEIADPMAASYTKRGKIFYTLYPNIEAGVHVASNKSENHTGRPTAGNDALLSVFLFHVKRRAGERAGRENNLNISLDYPANG